MEELSGGNEEGRQRSRNLYPFIEALIVVLQLLGF